MLSGNDQSLVESNSGEFPDKTPDQVGSESEDNSVSSSTSGSTGSTASSKNDKGIEGESGHKTVGLRTLRPLKKKTSFKSKKLSTKKSAKDSKDMNVDRATCSSTLKVLKLPEPVELQAGENESERISTVKVCSYHHCSLHDNCHSSVPSEKSVLPKIRHPVESQTSANPKNRSALRTKHSADKKRETQTSHTAANVKHTVGEKLSNIVKRSLPNDFGQSEEHDEEPKVAMEEKADSEQKNGSNRMLKPVRSSEANATASEGHKIKPQDRKHFSMWNLLHQQMVSDLPAEAGRQALQEADRKDEADDANTFPPPKTPALSPGVSDSHIGTDDLDAAQQEIELRKMFAIKLVREAIEKILLPEVQDQSSDDQSITSDVTSEHESLENKHGDDSTNFSSRENGNKEMEGETASDLKEVSLITDNIDSTEEQKVTAVGNKSDKPAPKRWSNLKKWILLQKFIKELEKVRKLGPKKPRHQALDPEGEAEEIHLRHQTVDERKNVEEWMLDYALQQAINQLAPTQQRKVDLLVRAFETIVPPQEDQHIPIPISTPKHHSQEGSWSKTKLDESVSEATGVDQKVKEIVPSNLGDRNFTITCKKCAAVDTFVSVDVDHRNFTITCKKCATVDILRSVVVDSQLCSKSDDLVNYTSEELPVDRKDQSETHDNTSSILDSELLNKNSESTGSGRNVKNDLGGVASEPYDVTLSSTPDSNGEMTPHESKVSPASDWGAARREKSESEQRSTAYGTPRTKLDKQNHIRMWHMVYQHVASGIAAKVGTQLLDESDEEQVEDANTSPVIEDSASCHDFSTTDHNASKENNDTSKHKIEFTRSDAVKLIQEAVNEILHKDIEDDSSDTQSTASDAISDQDLTEKTHGDGGEQKILISTSFINDSSMEYDRTEGQGGILLNQEQKRTAADNIIKPEELTAVSMVGNKFGRHMSKNWTKLKKLILLRRFIKALDKDRKLTSKPLPHLLVTPEPEPEKIDLRHQMMDERRKAEQWMLDYAVQHIVTKLTPARKRKVAMLVEAFEAVVPLPEF